MIVTGIARGNEKCGLVNEIDVIKVIDSFPGFAKAASTAKGIFNSLDIMQERKSFATLNLLYEGNCWD